MKSDDISPDKINRGQFKSVFGQTTKSKHLIDKQRQRIGNPNNFVGLSPEQIVERKIGHPDFSLLHPDSVAARLQRYLVLSYKNKKQLQQAKVLLSRNSEMLSASEIKDDGVASFSLSANDDLSLDQDQFQYGLYDSFGMNLQSANMSSAWDRVKGHAYVGIPDTGLDIGHPDFLNNFRERFSSNFVDDPNDSNAANDVTANVFSPYTDSLGHGQHVAGIIAADSDNDLGVAGICWNCSIMFARAWKKTEKINGYTFLANSGVQVINSSFPLKDDDVFNCDSAPNDFACSAVKLLADRDIVHVAAVGNGHLSSNGNSTPETSVGREILSNFQHLIIELLLLARAILQDKELIFQTTVLS